MAKPSAVENDQEFVRVVKRMLSTPHKPHAPLKPKRKAGKRKVKKG
jgi:hypothetical protein